MAWLSPGGCVWKDFVFTASLLAWCAAPGSWAYLLVEKIPEVPREGQDVLLSVHGVPGTIQDFNWYLGEQTDGSTRLFSYIPGLPRPQRNGSAMSGRIIFGFPNGSLLLRHARPRDSGTYQVAVTLNPDWTVKGRTELRVAEKSANTTKSQQRGKDGKNLGLALTVALSCLGLGALLVGGGLGYLLLTCWRRKSPGRNRAKQDLGRHMCHKREADGNNQYEVILSPGPRAESSGPQPSPAAPQTRNQEAEEHHYEELQDPDPAPYCQLTPTV
ncbi:carcinoembryonic antigen-related cell adhesion molecule 19 [Antechinus flavipes]|uniref:carcinoembryonic antigen-related cell adhesion molecule 19 n=1 Tax=Antechinus flavipes TaxID=38775 RepID=UPI00223579D0|nr:carcinoembryonic antigen-related cell adhesion molecule 19 [Antechinus flavipes]